jgi:TRAP-type transport system periplasmic protein
VLERLEVELERLAIGAAVHPAGELGDYTLIYDELIRGTVEMALISAPAHHEPRIEAQWLPFIAEDHAAVRETFGEDSFLFERMHEYHEEVGVEFLAFFGEGFIGLGATGMPENAAEPGVDKDMLVRVAPFRPAELVARDLGFRASTIPYADTYGALQTGVVEGWIGGSANLNYTGFRDVITHFLPYNVFYEATSIFVAGETWDALSDEDREIIREAVLAQSRESFDIAEAEDEDYLERMREAGIEVVTFSNEERGAMAEYARATTWPQLEDRLGDELIEEMRAAWEN